MVSKNGCKVKENKEVIRMVKILLAGLMVMVGLLLLAGPSSASEVTFTHDQFVNLLPWNVPHHTEPIPGMKTLPDVPGDHVWDWKEPMVPLYKGTR